MGFKRQRSGMVVTWKDTGRKGEISCWRWNVMIDLGQGAVISSGYEYMNS